MIRTKPIEALMLGESGLSSAALRAFARASSCLPGWDNLSSHDNKQHCQQQHGHRYF